MTRKGFLIALILTVLALILNVVLSVKISQCLSDTKEMILELERFETGRYS